MKLLEHFVSVNGEGRYQGYPVLFLRFVGCNLRCSYCDTSYSYEGGKEMSIPEVLDLVLASNVQRVTITGGEPLLQGADLISLCTILLGDGFEVEIETNGSCDISELPNHPSLCITMDWKTPSSLMSPCMQLSNLDILQSKDALKFVCGSELDLLDAKQLIINCKPNCQVFFSPVFGKIEPKRIVEFILENKLNNCRMQLQIHKFIWPPEERGV
jgi:7-carboxy-7-deazaguanine synthase